MPSNAKRPMAPPTNGPKPAPATSSPKKASANPAPQSSTTSAAQQTMEGSETAPPATTVNRKKQKRRQKQAARLAAERELNSASSHSPQNGDIVHEDNAAVESQHTCYEDQDDLDYTDDEAHYHAQGHAGSHHDGYGVLHSLHQSSKQKGKKKKNRKTRSHSHQEESSTSMSTPSASLARPVNLPSLSSAAYRSAHRITKDRIWNTSTHEERERIKEFWLQLGEEERRSLVKVEKEAVLRKMKEQQKHSCSCTVCGRKRTAIEEELEVLYDAYYEELEQYANHKQGAFANGTPIGAPPRLYQTPIRTLNRHSHHPGTQPSRGRVQELPDDDDEEEEEEDLEDDYDEDEEDDEPYSEDDLDEAARNTRADFLAFGNSLTVKDGILTVADDLLKNDGKHFIDMMEQLAERRMQREEDTQYAAASAAHQSMHGGHNHGPPPLDEEEYEEEEEEDYDSQDEEEYEEDDMDAMTEEQRMEEGRRMFQIFAARMFEQRVLTAYREKIARERQERLIQELEEETRLDVEREAKKAREAQKRKDKKRLQKQAKEEEKAKREAERAAEEAAQKALEEKRLEEQRRKKEEQRKKREAEKKAQEEERQRKEAERQKRLKEERERQAELERKQREQKEREKKKRDEAKKKEREEKEAREKELREKKAKEERERKIREEQAKREKEAAVKAERERKEKAKREEEVAQQAAQQAAAQAAAVQAAKRASQSGPTHLSPALQQPQGSPALSSPHFQVATPVVPKAPTPMRPRQSSQQGSHASSPRSQPSYLEQPPNTSISPGTIGTSHPPATPSVSSVKGLAHTPLLHHPQPSTPLSPLGGIGRGSHGASFSPMPSLNGLPTTVGGISAMGPRLPIGPEMSMYSNQPSSIGGQYQGFTSPNNIPLPPGLTGPRHFGQGRGFPMDPGHAPLPFHSQPGATGPIPIPQNSQAPGTPLTRARQPSLSFENQSQTQPIARPTPIQRPGSTVPHDQLKDGSRLGRREIDELSTQLGSSALLDDSDIPLTSPLSQSLSTSIPPGPPGLGRMGFGSSSLFSDPLGASKPHFSLGAPVSGTGWGSHNPFGPPGLTAPPSWGPSSGGGWSNNAFGMLGGSHRAHTSRPVATRLSVIQACKQLNAASGADTSGFHHVNQILRQVEQPLSPNEAPITLDDVLDICDTEGNPQNGGGSFVVQNDGDRGTFVKFEPDNNSNSMNSRGSIVPGDIGSPVPGSSLLAAPGTGARQFAIPNVSSTTGF